MDEHSVSNFESTTSNFGEFDVESDLGKRLELRSNSLREELYLPSVQSTMERAKDITEVSDSKQVKREQQHVSKDTLKRSSNTVAAKVGRSYHGPSWASPPNSSGKC